MPELEPIEVSPRKKYFPFRGIKELSFPKFISDPDFANVYDSKNYVLSVPLRLGGSEGAFSLLPVNQEFVTSDAETPLGKVRYVTNEEYEEGSEWVRKVSEAPLIFKSGFTVRSIEDYIKLSGHWIKLHLGRTNYLLRCIEPLEGDSVEDIEKRISHQNVSLYLEGYQVYDTRGIQTEVVIPGHPRSVGRVGLSFSSPQL